MVISLHLNSYACLATVLHEDGKSESIKNFTVLFFFAEFVVSYQKVIFFLFNLLIAI